VRSVVVDELSSHTPQLYTTTGHLTSFLAKVWLDGTNFSAIDGTITIELHTPKTLEIERCRYTTTCSPALP
jgi:hypothetical protein